jgi:hypothetical protein
MCAGVVLPVLLILANLCPAFAGSTSLHLSENQIMDGLPVSVGLTESHLSSGETRRAGGKNAVTIELLGSHSDLKRATIIAQLSSDGTHSFTTNLLCECKFVQHAFPEWPEAVRWTMNAVTAVAVGGARASRSMVVNHKLVSVCNVLPLGVMIVIRPV